MAAELFTIIAPVFVCVAIGFAWARFERPYETEMVTTLIATFGVPALVFSILTRSGLEPESFLVMAAATAATLFVTMAASALILRWSGLSIRAFLPALSFANTGNMGLPLCLFAFGPAGLALAIAYFATFVVGQFTIGIAIASGVTSVKRLLSIPALYAVALAVIVLVMDLPVPEWVANTTRLLGDMTIPLMLITLGVSLARLRVTSVKRSLMLSVLRLVMGFGVGLAVTAAFGLQGTARGVVILQSAMPVAVFNYLFAQRYETSPEEVAGLVVLSTALSFLSLPLLLWFVL